MLEQTEPGFQQRPFGLGGRLDIAVKSNPLAFRKGPRSHNRRVDRPEVFPARQPFPAVTAKRELFISVTVAEKPIVADALEPVGQDINQESSNELVGR